MRVVPLLSCSESPALWRGVPIVELTLDDSPTEFWIGAVRQGLEVHALHASGLDWKAAPAQMLQPGLGADFLVLPAEAPKDRTETTALVGALEFLLETARGPRIVLHPRPGSATALAGLMREIQAHAVGFCWDPALDAEREAFEDRLVCAMASPGADLTPLAALCYRWNVALTTASPEAYARDLQSLVLPTPTWPKPDVPAPETPLRWGSAWGEPS